MEDISRLAKGLAYTLLMTIALFLILNGVAFLFLKVEELRAARRQRGGWLANYRREAERVRVKWTPYSYWICKPFKGKYINVGSDGLRHPWHNGITIPSEPGKPVFRIFMLGGSTMWGWGESDDYTIPSALVRALGERGVRGVEITNFGQPGYVSTQELILFLAQLKRGNIPDLAIFYDGYNDTFSAFQNGEAGITENEANRAREFNSLNIYLPEERRALYGLAAKTLVSRLAIVRASLFVIKRLFPRVSAFTEKGADGPVWNSQLLAKGAGNKKLPQSVVTSYLDNVRLIAEAGKRMGFRTRFYWQPTLFSKAGLTPEEARIKANDAPPAGMQEFFSSVYREAHSAVQADPNKPYDLGFLDGVLPAHESCFIDLVHITRDCNDIIARGMAGDVKSIVEDARVKANAVDKRGPD